MECSKRVCGAVICEADFEGRDRSIAQVRDAAVGALDAWVGAVPAERVLPVAQEFLATPRAAAEGKTTGLRWLTGVVKTGSASRGLEIVLKAAAVGAADKAVEVREAAAALAATVAEVCLPYQLSCSQRSDFHYHTPNSFI